MKCFKLIDLADIKGGKRLPKGTMFSHLKTKHPYIRVRDIDPNQRLVLLKSDFEYLDETTAESLKRYTVNAGDIIISIVGTIGNIGVIDKSLQNANLTENCVKITNFKEDVDSVYLYYFLKSPLGYNQIQTGIVGAVQQKLPIKNIESILIPYFPLNEQKKMARVLKLIDDKIQINTLVNDNLQQQAFALFRELLHGRECSSQLSDYIYVNPERKLQKGKTARCIDMSKLSTTGTFPSGWEYRPYNGGMKFTNGDTILARITPCLENGKTALINFLASNEVAYGSTEYIVLAPKFDYVSSGFVYCLSRYPSFINYAVKNMNGSSGRQRVSGETISLYDMPVISQNEFVKFKERTDPFFNQILSNSLENKALAGLRDLLLPKLLSGELTSNIDW